MVAVMTMQHHGAHEFLHDGRAAAVAAGLVALVVVAAGIVAVLGGLMWAAFAVVTVLVG